MTRIEKKKEEIRQQINLNRMDIIAKRLAAIESAQLAEEIRGKTDEGIRKPYHNAAIYYGKQRALLRGCLESDLVHYDLPTVEEWNLPIDFSLPTTEKFAFQYIDSNGEFGTLANADQLYLTIDQEEGALATLENSAAYSLPTLFPAFEQVLAMGDGNKVELKAELFYHCSVNSLKLYISNKGSGKVPIAEGNETGGLTTTANGPLQSAIIQSGLVTVQFINPLAAGTRLIAVYDGYTDPAAVDERYQAVLFETSQENPTSEEELSFIKLTTPVANAPELGDSFIVRKRENHQTVGTVQVICEGLQLNTNWDFQIDAADKAMTLSQKKFNQLLGWLNPAMAHDIARSSDPWVSSSGILVNKEGKSTYPDIELSPFFPATDGTYSGDAPFDGNLVHREDEYDQESKTMNNVAKWRVFSGLKWGYQTVSAETGNISIKDPASPLVGPGEIDPFEHSGKIKQILLDTTIPADKTDPPPEKILSYILKKEEEDSPQLIYEITETKNEEGKSSTVEAEYSCYYNDMVRFVLSPMKAFQKRLNDLIALMEEEHDYSAVMSSGLGSKDSDFLSDLENFKKGLGSKITNVETYHNAFNPLELVGEERSTYSTLSVTDLENYCKNTINAAYSSRITDLKTEISGYSKKIFESCTYATHRQVGYFPEVVNSIKTIKAIEDEIKRLQENYAFYHKLGEDA